MLRLNHFRKFNSKWPMGSLRKGYALSNLFCLPVQ